MSRVMLSCLAAAALPLATSFVQAQITVLNAASSAPALFQATVGPDITIDNAVLRLGAASLRRAPSISANSYLPTGWAINPANGFTIQWWYRPAQALNFGYIFGDAGMVSPLGSYSGGRFRCFQSGACYCPAYTPTNSGGLTLRGVPNEAAIAGSPLTTQVDANGWIHLAVRYDPVTNNIDWLVNGALATSTPQIAGPFNWTGQDLDILGDRGSTSAVADGNYDDFRIYGFPRSNADILADYLSSAFGLGPSGMPNLPDQAYYEGEISLNTHVCETTTDFDPFDIRPRKVTANTIVEWRGNSLNLPGVPASCLINLRPGGLDPGCVTPGFPGLALCHSYSAPFGPALIFPDAHGLSNFGVGLGIALPYFYGGASSSPSLQVQLPAGLLNAGDELALQFLAPDPNYPAGVAASNVTRFVHHDAIPGPHARIEVRGAGAIQVFGFWRIQNTGELDITRVVIDCSPNPAIGFDPAGALNSGGSLALGSSYRFMSEITTGLQNLPLGYTGSNPIAGTQIRTLQFDFLSFGSTIDEFVFDCESVPANAFGNNYIGAAVMVTFAGSTVLMGTLAADPNDPFAAVLDL